MTCHTVVVQVVKDHLLGRLAAEVAWVNEYELGACHCSLCA